MHSTLKAIIVNSNIELQTEDIPVEEMASAEVSIASSHKEEQMDIEVSGDDFSAAVTEKNSDEFNGLCFTMASEGAILGTRSNFGNYTVHL